MTQPALFMETIMRIKVIKSGKENAKPSNFCPWIVDTSDWPEPGK